MTTRSSILPTLAALPLVALTGLGAPAVSARTTAAAPAACHSALQQGVLPVWARAGFSSPRPRMPHVMGRAGRIVAIEFGYPLLSPPSPDRANKILWVGKAPRELSNLWIRAQRMEGSRAVGPPATRLLRDGPGPSYVDLPEAGCWRLSLSWADGRHDTLDLQYAPYTRG
jgi:hypothetical protein